MLRVSLSSISGNRRRHSEYTPDQRGLIVRAVGSEVTPGSLERTYSIPKSLVRTTLSKANSRDDGAFAPPFCRPKSLAIGDRRHILRIVRRDLKIQYKTLMEKVGVTCSHDTIYRLLKEKGIINWLAKKRPLLTLEVVDKRYAWALRHEGWTWEDWAKVIWSDECSVERGSGKRREWVFRTLNQKWNKDMIQPYRKGKDVSIMVWACLWGMERSNLYALTRDLSSKREDYSAKSYLELLNDNLLEIYDPDLIFMQNNAPIHTVKKVKQWFENNGITVMEWPPYSLDLNSIEHL